MKVKYYIETHTIPPNGKGAIYMHHEHVEAHRKWFSKSRRFTLLGSSRHTLNGDVPKNYSKLMVEVGDLIYPVELKIDQHHQIELLNHEDILRQWEEGDQRLKVLYKQDPEVVNYIHKSEKNIYYGSRLLKNLQTNSFVQFFCMPEGIEKQTVNIYHIAPSVKALSKEFSLVAMWDHRYKYFYKDEIMESTLIIDYDGEGLLYEMSLKCIYEVENEGFYTKEIKIFQIK